MIPPDLNNQSKLTRALKEEAKRLGFDACGISEACELEEEARKLEHWLNQGRHASMGWMANNFDKRTDPRKLVDGARSIVSVLHNYYYPDSDHQEKNAGKISKYARGDDYHLVMKEKLWSLFNWLEGQVGSVQGRAFVDSAPVMDKAWAQRSGLGWIGKHSNLISRDIGSYFFIGELIVDVALDTDQPIQDYCGSCTRCIDACPTDAIYQPYVVDANRCISYLTIEHRADDVAPDLQQRLEGWIFGCDICQDVCPWNKFKAHSKETRYAPRDGLNRTISEWEEIDLELFRQLFRKNPVKRTKFEGFKRNIKMIKRAAGSMDKGEIQTET